MTGLVVLDPALVRAVASAWHRKGCALKGVALHSCRFRRYHEISAAAVVEDLRAQGFDVVRRDGPSA